MRTLIIVACVLAACNEPRPPPAVTLPLPSVTASASVTASPPTSAAPHEPAEPFEVTLVLATPGAEVELVSGHDVRQVPMFPIKIRFATTPRWVLHAKKQGYCPLDRVIDDAEPTITIELKPGC